jgi:DNA polymerase-3 subunit beta
MLDGQFPNYEKVIPKNSERKITFDRDEFLNAVRRVDIVANSNSQKAILETKGDVMQLTAESQDVGRAYEEVPIRMDGGDIKIAFNAKYLMEVMGIVGGDEATLELSGALNPGLLRPGNGVNESNDFLYVVMPMQV